MKLGASYCANRILRHVREDMRKMIDDGCNFVVHTMSEHDITYHSGTMVDIVKASRDVGLEVFPRSVGCGAYLAGNHFQPFVKTYPTQATFKFPEGEIKVYKACLNSKIFRDK